MPTIDQPSEPASAFAVRLAWSEAPHGISDHASRTAKALAGSLGWSMVGIWNSKHFPLYSHTMLIVGPEHARTFADDGWTRERLARHLHETVRVPYRTLVPDRSEERRVGKECERLCRSRWS